MAVNIRNAEVEEHELPRQTGESKTEAVTKALRDRLFRVRRERMNSRSPRTTRQPTSLAEPLLCKGDDFIHTDLHVFKVGKA